MQLTLLVAAPFHHTTSGIAIIVMAGKRVDFESFRRSGPKREYQASQFSHILKIAPLNNEEIKRSIM